MTKPRPVAAAVVLAAAVAAVAFHRVVRTVEADTSAGVLSAFGFDSSPIGTSVVFPIDGRLVGYALTAGCSVAFLLAPLYLVLAGLLATGRLDLRRGVQSLLVLTAVLFTVNQLRFAVIAWSMDWWGFETGYERSHIFLGTVVSTLGVLGGLLLVVAQVSRQRADLHAGDLDGRTPGGRIAGG